MQELLLVTKESIEERILRLHDTKRGVLANIWGAGWERRVRLQSFVNCTQVARE